MTAYTMFDTALGPCGLAWTERGLAAVEVPAGEATEAALRRRIPAPEPTTPPAPIAALITRIQAHLTGTPDAFTDVPLDPQDIPDFNRRAYDHIRTITPGETTTYGEVAQALGAPGSAQAVGRAMGRNPYPIVVPCHRVLGANGKVGGFSAGAGSVTKLRILSIEGAAPGGQPSLFD